MNCSRCGAALSGTPSYCPNCGAPVTLVVGGAGAAAIPGAAAGGAWAAPLAATDVEYGGFWRRFWAWVLDGILLNIVSFPVTMAVWLPFSARYGNLEAEDLTPEQLAAFFGTYVTVGLIGTVISWIYFALLHSSPRRATVGMMALGIQVTDLEGRKLSFARATGRFFAAILSGMILAIGYVIMLFTEKRQTLHDLIAGTVVVRKP